MPAVVAKMSDVASVGKSTDSMVEIISISFLYRQVLSWDFLFSCSKLGCEDLISYVSNGFLFARILILWILYYIFEKGPIIGMLLYAMK
jgi:hypothetical protein